MRKKRKHLLFLLASFFVILISASACSKSDDAGMARVGDFRFPYTVESGSVMVIDRVRHNSTSFGVLAFGPDGDRLNEAVSEAAADSSRVYLSTHGWPPGDIELRFLRFERIDLDAEVVGLGSPPEYGPDYCRIRFSGELENEAYDVYVRSKVTIKYPGGDQVIEVDPIYLVEAPKGRFEPETERIGIWPQTKGRYRRRPALEYEWNAVGWMVKFRARVQLIDSTVVAVASEQSIYLEGNEVSGTVSLANTESTELVRQYDVWLDGQRVERLQVEIPALSAEVIHFELGQAEVGSHVIQVGGHEATYEVKALPWLRVQPSYSTGEHFIAIGDPLVITGSTSLQSGDVQIVLGLADQQSQKTVEIDRGYFKAEFDTAGLEEGVYSVSARTTWRLMEGGDPQQLTASTPVSLERIFADIGAVEGSMMVDPQKVIPGEAAKISVQLKNSGRISGTAHVQLLVDGEERTSREVQVEPGPGQFQIVDFEFTPLTTDVGQRRITLMGLSRSLLVLPQPVLLLDHLPDLRRGQQLNVSGTTNLGDSAIVLIRVKGPFETAGKANVAGGRFETTFETQQWPAGGIYTIIVEGVQYATSGARDSASFQFSLGYPHESITVEVAPREVFRGETVRVLTTIENLQDVTRTIELECSVDGQQYQQRTVQVAANGIITATFEVSASSNGLHTVAVNGRQTTFFVTEPILIMPEVDTSELLIHLHSSRTRVNMGDSVVVTLSALSKLTHNQQLRVQVSLEVPSGWQITGSQHGWSTGPLTSYDRTLNPGDKVEASIFILPSQTGVYTLSGRVTYLLGQDAVEIPVKLSLTVGN